ncbi:hypothetical protein [Pendulispora albinea]|uniref:Lipoprotein n=1 Tax=Pendulispora albinea TaxID=2741071 RepID=A0ABZ2LZ89_9BACT
MKIRHLLPSAILVLSAAGFGLAACSSGGSNDGGGGGGAPGGGQAPGADAGGVPNRSKPAPAGYFAPCTQIGEPGDCPAGLFCRDYNKRGPHCTHACTNNDDCELPSKGCGANAPRSCAMPEPDGGGGGGGGGGNGGGKDGGKMGFGEDLDDDEAIMPETAESMR